MFLKRILHGDIALIYVYGNPPWRPNDAAVLVRAVRALPSSGLDVRVGGPTSENLDGRNALIDGLPMAAVILFATNVLILFFAFGSAVIPFILLNLILSCLAAIQAPIIMMSQNRQEAKD